VDTVRRYSRRCCETVTALIQRVLPFGLCGGWTFSQSFWALTTRKVRGAPEGCGLSRVETTASVGVARTSMCGPTAVATVPTDGAGVAEATGGADVTPRVWSAAFGLVGVHPARSRRTVAAATIRVGQLNLMSNAFAGKCCGDQLPCGDTVQAAGPRLGAQRASNQKVRRMCRPGADIRRTDRAIT